MYRLMRSAAPLVSDSTARAKLGGGVEVVGQVLAAVVVAKVEAEGRVGSGMAEGHAVVATEQFSLPMLDGGKYPQPALVYRSYILRCDGSSHQAFVARYAGFTNLKIRFQAEYHLLSPFFRARDRHRGLAADFIELFSAQKAYKQ